MPPGPAARISSSPRRPSAPHRASEDFGRIAPASDRDMVDALAHQAPLAIALARRGDLVESAAPAAILRLRADHVRGHLSAETYALSLSTVTTWLGLMWIVPVKPNLSSIDGYITGLITGIRDSRITDDAGNKEISPPHLHPGGRPPRLAVPTAPGGSVEKCR